MCEPFDYAEETLSTIASIKLLGRSVRESCSSGSLLSTTFSGKTPTFHSIVVPGLERFSSSPSLQCRV